MRPSRLSGATLAIAGLAAGVLATLFMALTSTGETRLLALLAAGVWASVLVLSSSPILHVRPNGSKRLRLRSRAVLFEPPCTEGGVQILIQGNLPIIGEGRVFLVVDTGAQISALSPKGSTALGLKTAWFWRDLRSIPMQGFGQAGPPVLRRLALEQLEFGELVFPKMTFGLIEVPGVHGLIGLAQLFTRVMCLDLQSHRLSLFEELDSVRLRHPWMASATPVPLHGSQTQILVEGTLDGEPVLVSIDTGAWMTSVREGEAVPGKCLRSTVGVQGEIGERSVTPLGELRIGSACFEPELAVLHPTLKPNLNLGADRLWGRVLVIDPQRRMLWISPPGARPSQVTPLSEHLVYHRAHRLKRVDHSTPKVGPHVIAM